MENSIMIETILGKVIITEENNFITKLSLCGDVIYEDFIYNETALLKKASEQLENYLRGKLKVFNLPLAPIGTEFQQRVWSALQDIPYGETVSYGEIAKRIGNSKAARAVGMANNRNPIAIIIPCHRVIGASGKLVGYGGGIEIKEKLLKLEENGK